MKTYFHSLCGPISPNVRSMLLLALLAALVTNCNTKKEGQEQPETKKGIPDSVYMQRGNQIVSLTFDTLRNSLLSTISSNGVDGAISFCNENAYPITGIYADSVVIRRTSLRVRNPNNKPDSLELLTLNDMEGLMRSSKMPPARVVRQHSRGEIHYFKPIILRAMCMNCHGTPGVQIQNLTQTKIKQLYPDDQAVNFKEGDLRGVWHIVFKDQKSND
ncbi:MAG: hypothetical protein C0490_10345 [Marivirga sp.]|nr:hypothetical protein [Marivirga sp.]